MFSAILIIRTTISKVIFVTIEVIDYKLVIFMDSKTLIMRVLPMVRHLL